MHWLNTWSMGWSENTYLWANFYKRKSDQYLAMIFNLRFPVFLKIRIGANMETSRFPWPNQATYLTGRGENKRYDCSALGLNKYLRIMKITIKPLLLIYC